MADLVRHQSGIAQISHAPDTVSGTLSSAKCRTCVVSTAVKAAALAVDSSHRTLRNLANAGSPPILIRAPAMNRPAARTAVNASQPAGGTCVQDRKSTRLNSSHLVISYAVFCLKKKKKNYLAISLQKKKKKSTLHQT